MSFSPTYNHTCPEAQSSLKKESNKPSMNIRPSVHPLLISGPGDKILETLDFSLLLDKKALKWALKVLDWYSLVRYG